MGPGTDQRNTLLLEYWPQGLLVIMCSIMSHVCLSSLARSLALLCFFLRRVFFFPASLGVFFGSLHSCGRLLCYMDVLLHTQLCADEHGARAEAHGSRLLALFVLKLETGLEGGQAGGGYTVIYLG